MVFDSISVYVREVSAFTFLSNAEPSIVFLEASASTNGAQSGVAIVFATTFE
jgi:hypothetical protein